MKELLIGLLMLGSISTFADTTYDCRSSKGEIYVTTKGNSEAIIDFSIHPVIEEDYFHIAYFDLLKDPLKNFRDNKLIISEELLEKEDVGYRSKFKHNSDILIANSNGGADFSSSRMTFKLNKKSLKVRLSYRVSAWLIKYGGVKDTLKCVKN